METKYIAVVGTIMSGLGKGVCSASISKLLKDQGYKVAQIKIDGYMNCDAGVMSPIEHGECFVTDDGGEIDLDFGTYERFTDTNMSKNSSITSGKLYSEMIEKERRGDYLGRTVQMIPHYTDYIIEKIMNVGKDRNADVVIIEVGGSLGDMESDIFIESLRQLKNKVGRENFSYFILTYIPFLKTTKELKTKLAQQSVKQTRSYGLTPDFLFCRTERKLSTNIISKISTMCDIPNDNIFEGVDVDNIYEVPIRMMNQHIDKRICDRLGMPYNNEISTEWKNLIKKEANLSEQVTIGIVGKYVELHDAYLSVKESLRHAGLANDVKVNIEWIDSEKIEDDFLYLQNFKLDGILVPGGFGNRGTEGKIAAIRYARERNIPFFGICLGMQMAVVEIARHLANLKDANSTEFNANSSAPVIHIMEDQKAIYQKGGTMRLGSYDCRLEEDTHSYEAYAAEMISERHRHRYEFNNDYREILSRVGLKIAGTSPNGDLVEIVELVNHPFFVGCQFHPEFKSRPDKPHPLFKEFVFYAKNIRNVKGR